MQILYNVGIRCISGLITIAGLFNRKAKQFVSGRKGWLKKLQQKFSNETKPVIWMHCASLGEFEQGRPVLEALRKHYPEHRLLLTFFSPSGYEVRKNYNGVDYVSYLPWDTRTNARAFVNTVKPVLAIFVKYEFWFHFSNTLRNANVPLISISSIFRSDQSFFKGYGGWYRSILGNFSWFFVQNEKSVSLLKGIGIENCTLAGDTRFDRVYEIVQRREPIAAAERFKAGQKLMVAGSCWHEDLDVLAPLINEQRLKFIIAPHEVAESSVSHIEKSLTVRTIRFSEISDKNPEEYDVLIVDNVGMLSKLYHYGEFAYVGGAFGKGLHNILEAACYGIPVFFGNKAFGKFQEAVDLINLGGAFDVADYPDLRKKYEMLNEPENFMLACEVTRRYVEDNLGATNKIMKYCRTILDA
ncbi:MAG TPA: glycosyltransferase N-terminal domain-containing protein [Ohtaekwangia sp.]|nr:glycosyltransferase N-terminal domain-containing protein [Ohtaekwangia sp.]